MRVVLKLMGVGEVDIEGVVPEGEDIIGDQEVEDFQGEVVAILGDVVKFAKE